MSFLSHLFLLSHFFPPTHYKQRGFGSCAVKVGLGSTCLCIFFGEGRARIQDTNVFVLLLTAGISGIVLKERILNRQCRALVHKHLVVSKLKRDPQLWELSTPSTLTASPIQGATGSPSRVNPESLIHRHEIYWSHDTFYLPACKQKITPRKFIIVVITSERAGPL